jgi:subfamily B ATP-binding cassette protein MsbA
MSEVSTREKLQGIRRVIGFNPLLSFGIVVLGLAAALLEGIGLSFIVPIVELAQSTNAEAANADGLAGIFVSIFQFLNIPFTLSAVIVVVSGIMIVRFTVSFFMQWLVARLRTEYIRKLQSEAFDRALDAKISYFDQEGSDDILNVIVTQAEYGGRVVDKLTALVRESMLAVAYTSLALYLAPVLTLIAALLLGCGIFLIRYVVESGYSIGDRVADANEQMQEAAQAGTQGIRDVRLFNMSGELFETFQIAVDQYTAAAVKLRRNDAAMNNFYQLIAAITVFLLIYIALTYTSLGLAGLGVFLFTMFRLTPRASKLNKTLYNLDGMLPHLVRTHRFLEELEDNRMVDEGSEQTPETIETVAFDHVSFSYEEDEQILDDLTFDVDRGDFVAFVGPSGAGKSTIVSLLAKLYEPDSGRITANETSIEHFEAESWRSQLAVVRQHPFIFNDTLRANLTVGNRDATDAEIERACEIAQVTEFLDELPEGFQTILGDNGVRLSGGQRQRVAIARALLKDAEVLVLDEATSDLDSELEEKVHSAIEARDQDQTMIVIAHRLSTVRNADRIYTMEDGRIVEEGHHEQLIENDGQYAQLYAMQ